MSDTLPLVTLTAGQWVDAYAVTGIAVGTPLIINTVQSETRVFGSISAAEPVDDSAVVPIPSISSGFSAVVTSGETGVWLRSTTSSKVSIQNGNS